MRLYDGKSRFQSHSCKEPLLPKSCIAVPKSSYPLFRKSLFVTKAQPNQECSSQASCSPQVNYSIAHKSFPSWRIYDKELHSIDPQQSGFFINESYLVEPNSTHHSTTSIGRGYQRLDDLMIEALPVIRNLDDILSEARAMSKEAKSDEIRDDYSFTRMNMRVGSYMEPNDDHFILRRQMYKEKTKDTSNIHSVPITFTETAFNNKGKISTKLQSYFESTGLKTPSFVEELTPFLDAYSRVSMDPTILFKKASFTTTSGILNSYFDTLKFPRSEESNENSHSSFSTNRYYRKLSEGETSIQSSYCRSSSNTLDEWKRFDVLSEKQMLRRDDTTKVIFKEEANDWKYSSEDDCFNTNETKKAFLNIALSNQSFSEDWLSSLPVQSARQDYYQASNVNYQVKANSQMQCEVYKSDSLGKDVTDQGVLHDGKKFINISSNESEEVVNRIRARRVERLLTEINKDYNIIISAINHL
jgi:hypothetical protein